MNASGFMRLLSGLSATVLAVSVAHAQQAPAAASPLYVSKPIMVSPLTGDDRKEIVLLSVSIEPTGAVPLHTHPGDCVGSVVDGAVELLVDGQAPRRIAAGEAYSNLRGTVHGFRNVGTTPARLLNNLVVDKGAPRVQIVAPAAKP
jgi:quercetin dioxygenase-like cupin family protein